MQRILGDHPAFKHHEVRDDLAVLILALDGLDNFVEHEMLRKLDGGNRAPETKLTRQFRLLVLDFLKRLLAAGMKRTPAYKFLAREITKAGQGALKPSGKNPGAPFSSATIKRWHERTLTRFEDGRPADRPDDAEWLFWASLNADLQSIDEAQKAVRELLQHSFVQAVFPCRLSKSSTSSAAATPPERPSPSAKRQKGFRDLTPDEQAYARDMAKRGVINSVDDFVNARFAHEK
jgi:hypothetical protein